MSIYRPKAPTVFTSRVTVVHARLDIGPLGCLLDHFRPKFVRAPDPFQASSTFQFDLKTCLLKRRKSKEPPFAYWF